MTEERRQAGAGYTGYEYREISVPREYVSLCLDSYPCFGWEEDPNYEQPGRRGAHARSGGAGEKMPSRCTSAASGASAARWS